MLSCDTLKHVTNVVSRLEVVQRRQVFEITAYTWRWGSNGNGIGEPCEG